MDFFIVIAVTADVMFAAMACGASGIRIRLPSCICMALISSGFLILSALGKSILLNDLPERGIRYLGFCALMCIGLFQIFGERIAQTILSNAKLPRMLHTGAKIFLDYAGADQDDSKTLSVAEAVVLAIPVSIDSLIGGLGIAAHGTALFFLFGIAFAWNLLSVYLGSRAAAKLPLPSDHARCTVCGCTLMLLGICKLL